MSLTKNTRKILDILLAVAAVTILAIVVGILFDYYYEFNDDVLMKNMLSGVYSGVPSGYNIQMLWPISALISLKYRIMPGLPIYGIFLCACHYGCAGILVYRSLRVSYRKRGKAIVLLVSLLFFMSIVLPHIVMAQYTVTVAIMAATAAYIFYTIPDGLETKTFYLQSLPAIILVWLAFAIRSEMLLLMLPYIAITGFIRWHRENSFHKNILLRYLTVVIAMFLGMGLLFGIDKLAYGSDEWKEFIGEFDARTQLYDYQYVPDYDENIDFYNSIALSRADVELLANYDYGIDKKIDKTVIGEVAAYAASLREETLGYKIKVAVKEYIYRIIHFTDKKYQILTLFMYVMFIWAILARIDSTFKHKIIVILLRIGGLFAMRSVSWLYIIMGHREPDRIVHSLYIIECVILFAMLLTEFNSKLREGNYLQMIAAIVLILGGLVLVPTTVLQQKSHIANQERINKYAKEIDAYCRANSECFYFEDVYSTIRDGETFNEKMFEDVNNTLSNYDLIGGWAMNSPICRQKLSNFGISDIADDILDRDDIFIICDLAYDTDWITNYYDDNGTCVEVVLEDVIGSTFGVYSVNRK